MNSIKLFLENMTFIDQILHVALKSILKTFWSEIIAYTGSRLNLHKLSYTSENMFSLV